VDAGKTALYDRLKIREAGPGYCHFPIGRDQEYFDQLTAEKKYTRYHHGYPRQEWRKPPAVRNEALDCRVYAYAALHALYASGSKLNLYCDRFAEMTRSRPRQSEPTQSEGRAPAPSKRAERWIPQRDWFKRG
jgi:phage terminase large subunit GpA-like protein